MKFYYTAIFALVSTLFGIGVPCAAEVKKVSSEEIIDSVQDLKRAVEQADKLEQLGEKYCHWPVAQLDGSDLDIAISRLLLNHSSIVPESIAASKMWRVTNLVDDIANQLNVGTMLCALYIRQSDASSTYNSANSILGKLIAAQGRFDTLAAQQTQWQEESSSYGGHSGGVMRAEVLSAAREMKDAANAAEQVAIKAASTKECHLRTVPERPRPSDDLSKFIANLENSPRSHGDILASDMWVAREDALVEQFAISIPVLGCSFYAEKKKARDMPSEGAQAHHRLRIAIASFSGLALRQTEWEEQNAQKGPDIREQ